MSAIEGAAAACLNSEMPANEDTSIAALVTQVVANGSASAELA